MDDRGLARLDNGSRVRGNDGGCGVFPGPDGRCGFVFEEADMAGPRLQVRGGVLRGRVAGAGRGDGRKAGRADGSGRRGRSAGGGDGRIPGKAAGFAQRGFSLIEIILVVVLIGGIVAFAATRILGGGDRARVNLARAQVQTIADKVSQFEMDTGALPSSLDQLVTQPGGAVGGHKGGALWLMCELLAGGITGERMVGGIRRG